MGINQSKKTVALTSPAIAKLNKIFKGAKKSWF